MNTLVAVARRAAELWPDQEALRFDLTGEAITFAEFDRRTDAIAAGLIAAGVERGDRVAVCTANTALFPLAWFGVIKAGAVMTPINITYRADDTRHILQLAEPKAVICDGPRIDLMEGLRSSLPFVELFTTDSNAPPGWRLLEALHPSARASILTSARPIDITNIQFTSGTSGMPKGCMLPHSYWIELAGSVDQAVFSLQAGETMLTAQAFSYIDPQWAFVLTLLKGARLVVLERFRPVELWEKIGYYEARFFYCLAAMPLMLLSLPASSVERRHKLAVVMCSAIPADRHEELEARFGVPWLEAYGATETGSDIGVSWVDHDRCVGTGTIGRPLPGREALIVDDNFSEVAQGAAGELLVRGESMMQGYWRNPEATASAFHNSWYRTGDIARKDQDGFFHLVGRRKDMIRRAGENIAAGEVEAALQQHPSVLLAACVPIPDPIRNEEIKVFVVPSEQVTVEELTRYLETRLARFKIPRYWTFSSALPMTASERVAKPQLSREIDKDVFDTQEARA